MEELNQDTWNMVAQNAHMLAGAVVMWGILFVSAMDCAAISIHATAQI